jgi:PIN domain nuclease of toxin-antitoxin system
MDKVRLRQPLSHLVQAQQEANRITILPLSPRRVYGLDDVKPFHKDPFDRMLVAQAMVDKLCLISSDNMLKN